MESFLYDFVFCIDGNKTATMERFLNIFKFKIENTYRYVKETTDGEDKYAKSVRVKIIVFRDFTCCERGIEESKFFTLPEQNAELINYVNNIKLTPWKEPMGALEAIYQAMKSQWIEGVDRSRHLIYLFSDKEASELNKYNISNYPSDMPASLAHLGDIWEGSDLKSINGYKYKPKRLIVYAPQKYPWIHMQAWGRTWLEFIDEGYNYKLDQFDFENALFLAVGEM